MQAGQLGFLCMSIHLEGEHFKLYEKEVQSLDYYEKFLKKNDGFTHRNRSVGRVYTCPLNYILEGGFLSNDHFKFVVNCIGFLFGVKLVSKQFSYVDNTLLRPFHLGFIQFSNQQYQFFIDKIITIYPELCSLGGELSKAKIIENAILLLFMSETKGYFLYEYFFALYSAIDCCYKYYYPDNKTSSIKLLEYLCKKVNIDTEKYQDVLEYVVNIRNAMMHEGLFLKAYFAHKPNAYEWKKYKEKRIPMFLKDMLIRIIFSMLSLNVEGFLEPGSLDQTSLSS